MVSAVPKPGKKYKNKRPTRDELVLEEIGERLVEAKNEGTRVTLTVWNQDEQVTGRICDMDARRQLVHVSDHGNITKVPFMDIMRVDNAEN